MSRPPRLCFEGALYHVTCRGDNRERIFVDDADRQQYLLYLHRYRTQLGFHLLCYCLMPNHVHLVIETFSSAPISKAMLCVSTRYTQYFNKRHGRVGHLFQGRFHSRLIESDPDLLVVSRYVHLNPVKAELCATPQEYPWSSYAAYIGVAADPLHLVDADRVLGMVSERKKLRVALYRGFVELVPVTFDPKSDRHRLQACA